ncbi:MAG: hypothetical protein IJZ70_01860 [Bacteroidales bacterium]|nr:hypothetical protein [Bacteroidales bacterium]
MENREQQILSEIKSMMASIRIQLERLDAKMAELQQMVDPEEFEGQAVDIDIVTEETDTDETMTDAVVQLPIEDDDDLPMPFPEPLLEALPEPEPVLTVAAAASDKAVPTINDVLAENQAWRKDMPGTPVRDIRSAISLNDRVIFINLLFNEDAQAFVDALTKINSMETLDQVVGFITKDFPQWDMDSDLVYRFMMAVRRKVK